MSKSGSSRVSAQPEVRPPAQQRSREAWGRILDAGVDHLADVGVSRFNVSAVCELARVAPTAVYSRVKGRDELLHAVYEHGMEPVVAVELEFDAIASTRPDVAAAVDVLVRLFAEQEGFLRAVVLGSSENAYINTRGLQHVARRRARFVDAAVGRDASPEARQVASTLATSVFAILALRLGFGEGFVGDEGSGDPVAQLTTLMVTALKA